MDWIQLGIALEFDFNLIQAIEGSNHYRVDKCCLDLLNRWLNGEACQPITWARLIEALFKAKHANLASELENLFAP